jgi:hypothetical protein
MPGLQSPVRKYTGTLDPEEKRNQQARRSPKSLSRRRDVLMVCECTRLADRGSSRGAGLSCLGSMHKVSGRARRAAGGKAGARDDVWSAW